MFLLNLCQKGERESDCWMKGTGIKAIHNQEIKALYTEIMQSVRKEKRPHIQIQSLSFIDLYGN